ncbi:MAG: family 43 glycosylhydrolase [Dysgonomonas sp.]
MNLLKLFLLLSFSSLFLLLSCGNDDNKTPEEGTDTTVPPEITSFGFGGDASSYRFSINTENKIIENNDSLLYDIDADKLVAIFKTKGKDVTVEVGGKVQVSGSTINDFTTPVVYDVFSEGEKVKSYTVKVNRKQVTNDFKSFGFNEKHMWEYSFEINSALKEIVCGKDLLLGTDVSNLKAYFTTVEKDATVLVNGIVQQSNITVNNFNEPIIYTVRSKNGSEKQYTVKMNFEKYRRYQNPVVKEDIPDPTVMKVGDYFYLYGTGHITTIYKSKNLVDWQYVGNAFTAEDRPNFVADAGMWAPDINYINGQYVLYYAMSTWGGQWTCGIGVAVSDKPEGPFKTVSDGGKMFISSEIGVQNSIDACIVEDNGKKYMFWGSFNGIYATELTNDGLRVKSLDGEVRIAGNWFEAAYVHKRGNYFYLFASIGSCCDGDNSTYTTVVGRSQNILGPYVNKSGKEMMYDNFEIVIKGDDRFVGPGHNSRIVQDDAGNDWMLYHTYIKGETSKGRVLALDRVDWSEDGWPSVSNGHPSRSSFVPEFND